MRAVTPADRARPDGPFADRRALAAGIGAALVVALGGVPRILLAAGALPDPLRPFVWSDALFVYLRGLSGQRLPYVDTPFEYPPLIGVVSGVLSLLSSGPVPFVAGWVAIVAVAAGCAAALLARAAGAGRAWRYWVLAPQLVLLGTVNFDLVPVALVICAALLARSRRGTLAAAALGVGAVAKLFPAASAPILVLRSSGGLRAAAAFAAVVALFYLPTALLPFSSVAGVGFYAVGIRSNLDSVWGLAERLLEVAGVPAAGAMVVAVTLTGLVLTYVFRVLPMARRAADPAVGMAMATLALLFWSRLFSPQYSLWVLPFFALLGLRPRTYALLVAADIGVFVTIYPLTLVPRDATDVVGALLLGALGACVVLRQVALLAMWRELSSRAQETA